MPGKGIHISENFHLSLNFQRMHYVICLANLNRLCPMNICVNFVAYSLSTLHSWIVLAYQAEFCFVTVDTRGFCDKIICQICQNKIQYNDLCLSDLTEFLIVKTSNCLSCSSIIKPLIGKFRFQRIWPK